MQLPSVYEKQSSVAIETLDEAGPAFQLARVMHTRMKRNAAVAKKDQRQPDAQGTSEERDQLRQLRSQPLKLDEIVRLLQELPIPEDWENRQSGQSSSFQARFLIDRCRSARFRERP
jgi:hypothetical protein